jgi:TRAP-type C4-dicarboxylate transport system substrate-binding protein
MRKIYFLISFLLTVSVANAQCNWINGGDATLTSDHGRGSTDWNAHYNYAATTADVSIIPTYIGDRMTAIKTCLSRENYAALYASLSMRMATAGIQFAGWTNSTANSLPNDAGCGYLDSAAHYGYVMTDIGYSNVNELLKNRMIALQAAMPKDDYAKLYADVSVTIANKAVTQTVTNAVVVPVVPIIPVIPGQMVTVKIGTSCKSSSTLATVLNRWSSNVYEQTNGLLQLKIIYNTNIGDEGQMLSKIKLNQLDGALISDDAFSKISDQILAFQMPGLFNDYTAFATALTAVRPQLDSLVKLKEFTLVDIYPAGKVRFMSKGFGVKLPTDLQNSKAILYNNPMKFLYQLIPNVTTISSTVPEIISNIDLNKTNVVYSNAYLADYYGYTKPDKLNFISDDVIYMNIGGLVISSKILNTIPNTYKDIILQTEKAMSTTLRKTVQQMDDAAYGRLQSGSGITVVKLTTDDQTKWNTLTKDTRAKLGVLYPSLWIKKLETLAGK